MLHQNDYMLSKMAADRQERLLAEARSGAIRKRSNMVYKPLRERFLLTMAAALIFCGKRLQKRYKPHYLAGNSHG